MPVCLFAEFTKTSTCDCWLLPVMARTMSEGCLPRITFCLTGLFGTRYTCLANGWLSFWIKVQKFEVSPSTHSCSFDSVWIYLWIMCHKTFPNVWRTINKIDLYKYNYIITRDQEAHNNVTRIHPRPSVVTMCQKCLVPMSAMLELGDSAVEWEVIMDGPGACGP